ncbi:Signal transduction histidine kinase [Candidatus Terasakiella magnetica]|nr:Signal transduction histidine kinase [Candidatus Terasakiella magnetica]
MMKGGTTTRKIRMSTAVLLFGAAVIAFIIATFSAIAWTQWTEMHAERRLENERLADTLAQHASSTLRQANMALSTVTERLNREGTIPAFDPEFDRFLAEMMRETPVLAAIRILTPEGHYRHSHPEHPNPDISVGDRDYLTIHRTPHSDLFVGRPVVSRVNGEWVLPLSLARRDDQGALVDVVAAMVRLNHLNTLFDSVRSRPNGAISLFRTDGVMLARGPFDPQMVGKDFAVGPLFKTYLPSNRRGSYLQVVATDGRKRHASYRTLDSFPVLVSVSSAYDDVVDKWQAGAALLIAIGLPLSSAATWATWVIRRQLREREAVERLLARHSADLELANEELHQVAEITAHHLQEPLRTILSYAQLLIRRSDADLDPETQDYIAFIRSGTDRMKGQLDSLQRYLAVERRGESDLTRVCLGTIMADVADHLSQHYPAPGIQIEFTPLPDVIGDRGQLASLCHHLIEAVTPPAASTTPQRVEITAEQDGPVWNFTLSAENAALGPASDCGAFPMFGAGSGRDSHGGRTLSLALCRKIIHLHGGRMWTQSMVGGRTVLHFTLPIITPDTLGLAQPASNALLSTG